MTTFTLYTKTLREAVTYGSTSDTADQDFDQALPGYLDRLRAELGEGDELVINAHDLSTRSLRDDDDQEAAEYLDQRVEFWA